MNKAYLLKSSLLGTLAFVLALLGQITLKGPLKNYSWILFFSAVALFVNVFRQRSLSHLSIKTKDLEAQPSHPGTVRFTPLVFSVIITVLSFVLFNAAYNPLAWLAHLLSICLFIAAFIQLPRFKVKIQAGNTILLVGILLLASLVRFWQLDKFPFGTWYDEAFNGNLASEILHNPGFRPIFFEADTLPSHLAYLFALSFRFFGTSTAAMRYVTAAFGVITVLLTYLLFRRWFNERIGLIAAFLFAVLRYDLTFSRIAMHGVTTPAFEVAGLYLLDRALEHKRFADFAWLGLVMGFGLAFYTPFRLFPLIIFAFLLLIAGVNLWRQRASKRDILGSSSWDWQLSVPRWELRFITKLGVMLIGMLIAISPVIQFAIQNREAFTARTTAVSIFERRDEPDLAKALWSNTVKHMLMFNVQGDNNGRHNWPGQPMLDTVMGTLFVLGLGYGLWRWRDPPNLWMLLIFFMMILPGIFSLDFEAPQSLRSIGVMPALIYFSVLPIALLLYEFKHALEQSDEKRGVSIETATLQGKIPRVAQLTILYLSVIGLLAAIAYLNINTYFNKQAVSSDVWAEHSAAETLVANEMNRLAGNNDIILSAMYDNYPTVRFLAGNITNYQRWTNSDRLPLIRQDLERGVVMLFDETLLSAYNDARRFYPNAKFIEHHAPAGGGTVLYEVLVAPKDLQAISGVVACYFEGNSVEGQPVKEEILTQAAVDWTGTQPLPGTFIAEFRSTLYAPEYGHYRFSVHGAPGSKLWIDEFPPFPVSEEPLTLARGNHSLRLQVPGGNSKLELWWQPPNTAQEEPVLGAYLFRPPVTNSGLLGAYYPSPDWSGEAAFYQIDPEIAFYFHVIPLPRPYSVQWIGKLFAPATGEYHFALNSVDGSQLMLDNQLVVDNPNGHTTIENITSLTEGWHDVTVRFSDQTSATQIYLYWTPPGKTESELVPTRYLSPPMGQYPIPNDADH
jgi:4-amino-4-deoxy-L-arabinose transferase and related glycosyltransferases of PMT family